MGNQSSNCSGGNRHGSKKCRGRRADLDERCKPSGLYDSCAWEDRTIRRLIGNGKLAARLVGKDCRVVGMEQECPICILHYDEINMLKCCKAMICTECYLQVQDPKEKDSPCPFCKKKHISTVVAKRMDEGAIARREEEEQKVLEATIRARSNSESIAIGSSSDSRGASTQSRLDQRRNENGLDDVDLSNNRTNLIGTSSSSLQSGHQTNSGLESSSQVSNERGNNNSSSLSTDEINDFLLQAALYLDNNVDDDHVSAADVLIAQQSEANQVEIAIQLSLAESQQFERQNVLSS